MPKTKKAKKTAVTDQSNLSKQDKAELQEHERLKKMDKSKQHAPAKNSKKRSSKHPGSSKSANAYCRNQHRGVRNETCLDVFCATLNVTNRNTDGFLLIRHIHQHKPEEPAGR